MKKYFFLQICYVQKSYKNENGIENVARLDQIEFSPKLNQIEFGEKNE